MGCELHRELPAVLAFEAYKVKFKPKEALHKSLKKFWASSIKCFVKHLQAKKKKKERSIFALFRSGKIKMAASLKPTDITQTSTYYNYPTSTAWAGC